ncbi:hypothetical protein [Brenneria goodwinii]|nr:hypothetical protein [Brenneria goodwinii]
MKNSNQPIIENISSFYYIHQTVRPKDAFWLKASTIGMVRFSPTLAALIPLHSPRTPNRASKPTRGIYQASPNLRNKISFQVKNGNIYSLRIKKQKHIPFFVEHLRMITLIIPWNNQKSLTQATGMIKKIYNFHDINKNACNVVSHRPSTGKENKISNI